MFIAVKREDCYRRTFPRFLAGLMAAVFLTFASTTAQALFGNYMPMSLSGSVGYNYNYISAGDSESETTMLTGTLNANGFIWQPWFATTSVALNLGISNTETSTSSSNSTNGSGSLGLNVFPRSRFPFTLNFSHSDSTLESYSDYTRFYGDNHYTVTRLTLRQIYEGRPTRRSIGSRTYLYYSTTDYNSDTQDSQGESLGAEYQIRLVPHSFTATANRSTSKSSNSPYKPRTDVVSITHAYTPSSDLGITNLGSYVNSDSGGSSETTLSQLSSNFFWRPEHRAVNVNGGVRVSDSQTTDNSNETELKSLNSNLGFSYRLTRNISMGASLSIGSSDSGVNQSLTTSQTGQMSYVSNQINVAGFIYNWQGGINGSNSVTRVDDGTSEKSTEIQTSGVQLGHSASKRWAPGSNTSVGMNASQSGTVSSSSTEDEVSRGINHSVGMSWNTRGKSGSVYGNVRVSDARSYTASQTSEFQNLSSSLSEDWTINRLSFLSGTLSYTESRQKTDSNVPGASTSSKSRTATANASYRHDRPFGIFNLNFTSRLLGSRYIDNFEPKTIWDWDNRFRYHLGLLDTALSLRIIDNSGGEPSKSLYFQATRSF